jgi:hypothetical protein
VDGPYPGDLFDPFGALLDGLLTPLLLVGVLAFLAIRISRRLSAPSGDARETPGAGASLLETLSVLAVGVLTAFFVGFGIQAFYPAPEFPEEQPVEPEAKEELMKEEKEDFAAFRAYEEEISEYNRVASFIAVGIAVLILAAVLHLKRIRIRAIRDGVALGGCLRCCWCWHYRLRVTSSGS